MNLPNRLTMLRILLIPVFMVSFTQIPYWIIDISFLNSIRPELISINIFIAQYGSYIGAVIFLIAAGTDKMDGYIARKKNMVTNFGIFLDPIADKLMITAALIFLVQSKQVSGWVAVIIIAREFIITGLRLVAAAQNVVLPAGKLGKAKMVAQSTAIALTLLKNYPLSMITGFPFDKYAMVIAVIITVYSGYDYLSKNRMAILRAGI